MAKKKKSKKSNTKKSPSYVRKGLGRVSLYLTMPDSKAAIKFYEKAFGAKERGRLVMQGGAIGHAEIKIGDQVIMMADENPDWGNVSPLTLKGTPFATNIYVKDVDKAFRQAIKAGAKQVMPVSDQFYGDRSGVLEDPYGYRWSLATNKENPSFKKMQKRMDTLYSQAPEASK